jgi:hypothetical protein
MPMHEWVAIAGRASAKEEQLMLAEYAMLQRKQAQARSIVQDAVLISAFVLAAVFTILKVVGRYV